MLPSEEESSLDRFSVQGCKLQISSHGISESEAKPMSAVHALIEAVAAVDGRSQED